MRDLKQGRWADQCDPPCPGRGPNADGETIILGGPEHNELDKTLADLIELQAAADPDDAGE
jgi:hypothetical protein